MRAAWYRSQGAARDVLEIGELPDPTPGPGEVRVRLAASGINPTDLYARSGRQAPLPYPLVVPHQDGAGVVDAVGPDVGSGRVGERVWVHLAQFGRPLGTAAEFVVVPDRRAVRLPDRVRYEEGASLGVPWMTAFRAVTIDPPLSGELVLIAGGAGAVAFYAIQIAAAAGADVIASVGDAPSAALAIAAGARATIDFRQEDLARQILSLTDGRGVDRVVESHVASNIGRLPGAVRDGGTIVVYGTGGPEAPIPASWALRAQLTIRFIYAYAFDETVREAAIARFTELAEAGRLVHLPVRTFPLERIAAAHEAAEEGNHGSRVIVTPETASPTPTPGA
jgi:NADPH2:quinone reductase